MVKNYKIGDKVHISHARDMYDAEGEIIGETPKFWKIKIFNHRTFGELWNTQHEETALFHKKSQLKKGFSKGINTGDITNFD